MRSEVSKLELVSWWRETSPLLALMDAILSYFGNMFSSKAGRGRKEGACMTMFMFIRQCSMQGHCMPGPMATTCSCGGKVLLLNHHSS